MHTNVESIPLLNNGICFFYRRSSVPDKTRSNPIGLLDLSGFSSEN